MCVRASHHVHTPAALLSEAVARPMSDMLLGCSDPQNGRYLKEMLDPQMVAMALLPGKEIYTHDEIHVMVAYVTSQPPECLPLLPATHFVDGGTCAITPTPRAGARPGAWLLPGAVSDCS